MSEVARILLAASGSRALQSRPFTASGSWTAPATTTQLETLVGRGSNGTPATPTWTTYTLAEVSYFGSGSGNTAGVRTWSQLTSGASGAVSAFNAGMGGAQAYSHLFLIQYPSTYTQTTNTRIIPSGIAGTASLQFTGDWAAANDVISGDGTAYMSYQVMTAATNGTASTAFSRTFAGGVGGAATPVTYTGVAVTPGTQYLINVPAGGSVVIEYYE